MQYTLNVKAKCIYQAYSLANLLRMGHCAPAIMQTLLDVSKTEKDWLVRLTAGLPGGIGSTGFECGGLTSPLIILGLRYGLHEIYAELPRVFDFGHSYLQLFSDTNGSFLCKEIQTKERIPTRCIRSVCRSPEILAQTFFVDNPQAIPAEKRRVYACLYTYLTENNFHCAHAVFQHLQDVILVNQELLDATSAYLGGTLLKGLTCSAFAAGVMAIGLKVGEIENSYWRVLRMLSKGVDIRDERANKFHRTLNTGYRLSKWFVARYGSTQCQAITQCDFSSIVSVKEFIANDGLVSCCKIADEVAKQVQDILEEMKK